MNTGAVCKKLSFQKHSRDHINVCWW